MKNLRIVDFNSTRDYGQMNSNSDFFPSDMNKDEIKKLMREHKHKLVSQFGLSYKNIFIPIQKNSKKADKYPDGLCYTLTPDDVEKYEDLYDYDVHADILKLTPATPNMALAFPVADCAVVKAFNMKTNEVVLSHCGGEYIDRYLPMQTIDALGGSESDIKVYISPFAYTLFYDDETKLTWANNEQVWNDCKELKNENGLTSVKIDVYKALKKQLLDRKIKEENIVFSPYDINKTDMFYSNSRGYKDSSFKGRFLAGIALIDDSKEVEEKEYIKVVK